MNRACDHLFACACLTLNENGAFRRSHDLYVIKYGLKSCAGAN